MFGFFFNKMRERKKKKASELVDVVLIDGIINI